MRKLGLSKARLVIGGIIIAAGLTASSALTASNTVDATVAGSGAGAISGYTVSSVGYTLNSTNPGNVDAVTFTLNASATTVKAKLVSAGSTWYSCSVVSGNNYSCATTSPQATLSASDQLSVVATQ